MSEQVTAVKIDVLPTDWEAARWSERTSTNACLIATVLRRYVHSDVHVGVGTDEGHFYRCGAAIYWFCLPENAAREVRRWMMSQRRWGWWYRRRHRPCAFTLNIPDAMLGGEAAYLKSIRQAAWQAEQVASAAAGERPVSS